MTSQSSMLVQPSSCPFVQNQTSLPVSKTYWYKKKVKVKFKSKSYKDADGMHTKHEAKFWHVLRAKRLIWLVEIGTLCEAMW